MVRQYGQAEVTIPYTDRQMVDYLSMNVSVLNVKDGLVEVSLSSLTIEWFIGQKFIYRSPAGLCQKS